MGTCFVIQPFDRGKYDKRYEDVFAPAITDAGLKPYRVDRDPGVTIPVNEIETGIEAASACLADITTDNPNVWFELGYAIARQLEVVLICSKERTEAFPFDVQHRNIITYSTDSSSDFDELRKGITARLSALLAKEGSLRRVQKISSTARLEGLEQHEIAALVSVAQLVDEPEGTISAFMVRQDMEKAGFTKIATTLGVRKLLKLEMIRATQETDYDGENFTSYGVTDSGVDWLVQNKSRLTLKEEPASGFGDDDIPF